MLLLYSVLYLAVKPLAGARGYITPKYSTLGVMHNPAWSDGERQTAVGQASSNAPTFGRSERAPAGALKIANAITTTHNSNYKNVHW